MTSPRSMNNTSGTAFDMNDTTFVCVDIQPRKRGERVWTWENRHPEWKRDGFTPDELNAAEDHFHDVMLPNALEVAAFAKERALPRVFVHWADGEVHEAFDLSADDRVVPKTEMDAFISSDIGEVLDGIGRWMLLMIGGHTQGCLGRTAASALRAGYRCTCVRDATFDCSIIRWPKGIADVAYDLVLDTADLPAMSVDPG